MKKAAILKADETSKVEITYKNLICELNVDCSTSNPESYDFSYDGDTEEGTVLDENNDGFHVVINYKNGTCDEADGWTIKNPVTLEADKTAEVEVIYENQKAVLKIECSTKTIKSIKATYTGDTEEKTVLNENNTGISVEAIYTGGKKEKVIGWTVKKSKTLKAGKTSEITIEYEGKSCKLKVKCTTLTAKQEKEQYIKDCESFSYKDYARNPDAYMYKKVRFSGKVIQVMEGSSSTTLRINKDGEYDNTIYVEYDYADSSSRILEDDYVTVYGLGYGLITYETVLGASVSIPGVDARYITR